MGLPTYQVAVIVANAVAKALLGHRLKLATNAALTRTMGIFAGPIGWALTGLWTLIDVAGPCLSNNYSCCNSSCVYSCQNEIRRVNHITRG